jgi:hypothetical protein
LTTLLLLAGVGVGINLAEVLVLVDFVLVLD